MKTKTFTFLMVAICAAIVTSCSNNSSQNDVSKISSNNSSENYVSKIKGQNLNQNSLTGIFIPGDISERRSVIYSKKTKKITNENVWKKLYLENPGIELVPVQIDCNGDYLPETLFVIPITLLKKLQQECHQTRRFAIITGSKTSLNISDEFVTNAGYDEAGNLGVYNYLYINCIGYINPPDDYRFLKEQ